MPSAWDKLKFWRRRRDYEMHDTTGAAFNRKVWPWVLLFVFAFWSLVFTINVYHNYTSVYAENYEKQKDDLDFIRDNCETKEGRAQYGATSVKNCDNARKRTKKTPSAHAWEQVRADISLCGDATCSKWFASFFHELAGGGGVIFIAMMFVMLANAQNVADWVRPVYNLATGFVQKQRYRRDLEHFSDQTYTTEEIERMRSMPSKPDPAQVPFEAPAAPPHDSQFMKKNE